MSRKMLSEEDLDQLLSRASRTRPGNRAALDDERVAAALDGVWHDAESSVARAELPRSTSRAAHGRRWVVAAAVVGVASFIGVESLTGSGGSVGSGLTLTAAHLTSPTGRAGGSRLSLAVSHAAAVKLDTVAHAAAAQPALSPGEWYYTDTQEQDGGISIQAGNAWVNLTVRNNEQTWSSAGLDQRTRITTYGESFATPQDQANYDANKASFDKHAPGSLNPTTATTSTSDKVFSRAASGAQPLPAWWNTQISDPQTLLADIAQQSGPLSPDSAFAYFGELQLIMTSATSPQFRAMAFAASEYLPGVTVLGNQTDKLGRSGTEISFTDPNPSGKDNPVETVIVSPSTGEMLESIGTQRIAVRGLTVGTPDWLMVYVQQGLVDSDTALPDGGTQPISPSAASTTPTTTSVRVAPVSPTATAFGVTTANSTTSAAPDTSTAPQ